MTSFTWSNPPVQVYINPNPLPIIYWRNRDSNQIFSIPLTPQIEQNDLPMIAYLIRRHYADHMRKFLQQQIAGGGESIEQITALQISACLPIQVLDLNTTTTTLLNAGKLINWFIYITSIIFPPQYLNVNETTFYIRNENIGIATMKTDDMIKEILGIYTMALTNDNETTVSSAIMGEGILNLSDIFKLLSDKILKILKTGHKNSQKLKTKKKGMAAAAAATAAAARITGGRERGTDSSNMFDTQLENEFRNCITGVEDRMKQFKDMISFSVTDESNESIWAVKQFIRQISHRHNEEEIEPIYLNVNITFRTMFHAIGEIMNTVCLQIMPRLSMADAIGASVFHILYLKDLNLLESFIEQINLPILTRLINACFTDDNNKNTIYRRKNSSVVYNILSSLPTFCCNNNDDLHQWIIINEESYTQGIHSIVTNLLLSLETGINEEELYYGINDIRGCTIEYYMIRLICHYTMALTVSGGGKHLKDLNKKNLISCLYKITACIYHFVKTVPSHLLNAHILTDNTFGSNPVYKKIIKKALEEFLCVNMPLLSES